MRPAASAIRKRQTLWRVHVPLLRGSLFTAMLLVFVDVMKELPATLVMRPFNFDTLATQTYTLASDERLAEAALPRAGDRRGRPAAADRAVAADRPRPARAAAIATHQR